MQKNRNMALGRRRSGNQPQYPYFVEFFIQATDHSAAWHIGCRIKQCYSFRWRVGPRTVEGRSGLTRTPSATCMQRRRNMLQPTTRDFTGVPATDQAATDAPASSLIVLGLTTILFSLHHAGFFPFGWAALGTGLFYGALD
jgi:hypothetical protein